MNWIEILKAFVIALGALYFIGFVWAGIAMTTAPEGREDEEGFHQL